MKGTLEPSKFLEEPETLVANLDCTSEISVNAIFSEIPAQTGSLKHIVQIVTNKWLTEMIPDNLRHNFSVSTKPQKPQVSLPSRFINPPIAVLSGAIQIHGCDREKVAITVALLFQHHLDYCFSHARHRMQKQKKDENTSA
ncbi:unnamed protein product [Caenorhabditis sp. 36 PRJEB53466]|nr:unnamed protein product [Caenorhabditis sp. 36 PRJEB53466]